MTGRLAGEAGAAGAIISGYHPVPGTDDASRTYIVQALGAELTIRERSTEAGVELYIGIDTSTRAQHPDVTGHLVVEVNNDGGNEYGGG